MQRWILHLDMDSFFVSVERLKNPKLIGKPVVVGGRGKRAVVASASYEARKFGVHSAMPMVQAQRLCRNLVIVTPSSNDYSLYSRKIFSELKKFAPIVEQVSIDEAYLDLTGCEKIYSSRLQSGEIARKLVFASSGLTATVGVATNKLLAKVASSHAKPNGLLEIAPGKEAEFLAPLPIETIPGVGGKTKVRLNLAGIKTCADLIQKPIHWLRTELGSHALELQDLARGIDTREVSNEEERKSIGEEQTFRDDIGNMETLFGLLREMSENLGTSLRREDFLAATVQIKIRYGDFSTYTRAKTLREPTYVAKEIAETAQTLLKEHKEPGRPLRLLGVSVRNLIAKTEIQEQLDLFSSPEKREKTEKLERAKDALKKKFGDDVLVKPQSRGRVKNLSDFSD